MAGQTGQSDDTSTPPNRTHGASATFRRRLLDTARGESGTLPKWFGCSLAVEIADRCDKPVKPGVERASNPGSMTASARGSYAVERVRSWPARPLRREGREGRERREPWGARDFIVMDPDGNLLLFAGPAE